MSVCVLDTDVVIAAIDRSDAHHARAADGILKLTAARTRLLMSAVNFAEALVRPAREEATLRVATDAIAALGIEPVPATGAIGRDAARLCASGISLPDGFALATARERSATCGSFDARVLRAMGELGLEPPPALA